MGVIKRILASLGAKGSSRRLIVNSNFQSSEQANILKHNHQQPQAIMSNRSMAALSSSSKKSKRHQRKIRRESEVLLLAAQNHLPPVQFHHVHGPNAQLSKNKLVARRTQSFCQALVFSNRVILPNERVYIKVLEIAKGWSGTIRFGFTSVDPATLRYQIPKHACPDMTSAGHTWARALADEVVRRNSVIHFSYSTNGYIHYGINNQDCGVFFANVNTNQNLWFIIDIYGLTTAVELIDPRIHSASDLERSRVMSNEQARFDGNRIKLVDEIGEVSGLTRSEKKRLRKAATRLQQSSQQHIIYGQPDVRDGWQQDSIIMSRFDPAQAAMLPNLNSILLPGAQQNIYTPMPPLGARQSASVANLADTHDYYQIMTNTNYNVYEPTNGTYASRRNPNGQTVAGRASARHSNTNLIANSTSASSSSSVNNGTHMKTNAKCGSSARNQNRRSSSGPSPDDEQEICQQIANINFTSSDNSNTTIASSSSHLASNQSGIESTISNSNKNSKSHHCQPIAATRKSRQNNSQISTSSSSKRDAGMLSTTLNKSTNNQKHLNSSNTPRQSKERLSTKEKNISSHKSSPATTNRDENNNSPIRNDCPICFERPINCVLYQCGHMCTCYECGVKQWRTQSRTCPICRTVIKDVIKTYMS